MLNVSEHCENGISDGRMFQVLAAAMVKCSVADWVLGELKWMLSTSR